jgi:dienelactone hydrolase
VSYRRYRSSAKIVKNPMRPGTLAVLFALLAPITSSQEMRLVYPIPAPTEFTQRNLVYKQVGQTKLSLDFFFATRSTSAKPLPVFVIFNGFGGEFMRTSAQAQGWAKAATAHGFAAITADTTEGHVDEDFESLSAYLRQHAEELHIDPERLVVIAWSGNVSAGLPTVEDSQRKAIRAAVIYYGSADVPKVRLDLPVLFVRAGLDQPLTNQNFDKRIAAGIAANAPWTVVNYPGGRHGFDVFDDNALSREIIEETFQFAQLAISDSHQSAMRGGLAEATAAGAMYTEDFAGAAALYRQLVAAHSKDARLLLAYGIALSGAKQYKEARAQFDRAQVIGGLGLRDLGLPAAKASALDHDLEAAMAWLKTIPPQFLPASVQSDAAFVELKDRPDFQALFHAH